MLMIEKKMHSTEKELAKINKSIDRITKAVEKKTEVCKKLNCLWTDEEAREKQETCDKEQFSAWWDLSFEKSELEDYMDRKSRIEKKLRRETAEVETAFEKDANYQADIKRAGSVETKYWERLNKQIEEYEKWLEEFKAMCAEDGITVEEVSGNYFFGKTKNNKSFAVYINNGFTERSFHCYTLRIDGITLFTSGKWWLAYSYIKNS